MRSDSRIEDVLPTLKDPEEYVRGIIASFVHGQFPRNEAMIRMGVSGAGIAPHYCIEQGRETLELGGQADPHSEGKKIEAFLRRVVFDGRTHKQILEDLPKGTGWSSETMTFAEVQAILGRLRSSKKAH
ncbi:hypothetical protein [Methylocystis suflitae]|uniref:hypothetical protein n=1 Tax=Methylocystis suflitae TaxID=2951405 RepID=UPI00210A8BF1|nr:hypothetical protein [Methylocystis suflitae]MCQ4190020.1 hypothetical protein [Methylocystis suflitae]